MIDTFVLNAYPPASATVTDQRLLDKHEEVIRLAFPETTIVREPWATVTGRKALFLHLAPAQRGCFVPASSTALMSGAFLAHRCYTRIRFILLELCLSLRAFALALHPLRMRPVTVRGSKYVVTSGFLDWILAILESA